MHASKENAVEKRSGIVARYDAYFLKPQWIAYVVLIIVFLVRRQWLYAGVSLFMEVATSLAGATLYPKKGYHELAQGTLPKPGDVIDEELSYEDSVAMGKAGLLLGWSFGASAFAVLVYGGVRWWFALPLAFAAMLAYTVFPLLVLSLFRRDSKPGYRC
jgi:hypothetical protein